MGFTDKQLTLAETARLNAGENPVRREGTMIQSHRPRSEPYSSQGEGVDLAPGFMAVAQMRLRESPDRRRGDVEIAVDDFASVYALDVNGNTVTSSGVDGPAVISELTTAVRALAEPVHANARDGDGDGDVDKIELEGRWSKLEPSKVSDNTDYEVDARVDDEQQTASYTSAAGATTATIVNGVVDALNSLNMPIHAEAVDTTGNGDPDAVFVTGTTGLFVNFVNGANMGTRVNHGDGEFDARYNPGTSTGQAELYVELEASVIVFDLWLRDAENGEWWLPPELDGIRADGGGNWTRLLEFVRPFDRAFPVQTDMEADGVTDYETRAKPEFQPMVGE